MSQNRPILTIVNCQYKYLFLLLHTFKPAATEIPHILIQHYPITHSKWTIGISGTKMLENVTTKHFAFPDFQGSLFCKSMTLPNRMWKTGNLVARSFSNFTVPVFQKKSEDNNKGKEGGGEKTNSSDTEVTAPQQVYDPKSDSFFTQDSAFGSKENKGGGEVDRPVFIPEGDASNETEDLSPPTNCCQSGCPNCVWIEYLERLTKKYTDPNMSREKVLKELNSLDDQNIKAFIMMELRTKKLI